LGTAAWQTTQLLSIMDFTFWLYVATPLIGGVSIKVPGLSSVQLTSSKAHDGISKRVFKFMGLVLSFRKANDLTI
jgi:hypothetical protein